MWIENYAVLPSLPDDPLTERGSVFLVTEPRP